MKHCVITGTADGIGRALAWQYAQAGYRVTGIDIDIDMARQTQAELAAAGLALSIELADLTSEEEIERLLARLGALPPIDVLIHNAGISAVGRFAQSALERQQQVVALNLRAPLLLTAGILGQDRLAAGGSLVFIASLSRFTAYPGAAVYAATKDGLASYARSLAVGLHPRGIHVLTVYPGPTRTAHARRYSPDNRREARRMPPEQLARMVYQSVQSRRPALIPGRANRAIALLGTFFPPATEWLMRRTILEKLP